MTILRSFRFSGASSQSLLALEKALDGCCPDLVEFYRQTNGFEMQLEPDYESEDLLLTLDCMKFDEAAFVVEMMPLNEEWFPEVIVIGGDSSTNRIALDLRAEDKAPLVVFRADEEPYLHTCRIIAPSFAEFLQGDVMQRAVQDAELYIGGNSASL